MPLRSESINTGQLKNNLAGLHAKKMNGAGNQIVVLDLRNTPAIVTPAAARAIACMPRLHYDQLMVLYRPEREDSIAAMKIFNNDGSLSGACGNGTRCVAACLMPEGQQEIALESDGGFLRVMRAANDQYTVDMGIPGLAAADIPLSGRPDDMVHIPLIPAVSGAPDEFSAVNMGNPHAVFFVADASAVDLTRAGPAIERHPLFPRGVNVSFAQIMARDHITLRVWERGAGATLACGTAACATLVASVRANLSDRAARISLPGGELFITWRASDNHVTMTGPVEFEYDVRLDEIFLTELHHEHD